VAVKVIERAKLTGTAFAHAGHTADYFQNEIRALRKCDNEHIVKFIDVKKTSHNYYLIMEYCEGGDLARYLKDRPALPEEQAIDIFFQILRAFRSLVRLNFIHRDLKPENIFFKHGKVKIGDFGLSIMLRRREMTNTYAGSPLNMAPEILRHEKYDNRADIYSIGTVLYEMLFQT
jgi:serine/threonine-protein kinase ULK/ATG1